MYFDHTTDAQGNSNNDRKEIVRWFVKTCYIFSFFYTKFHVKKVFFRISAKKQSWDPLTLGGMEPARFILFLELPSLINNWGRQNGGKWRTESHGLQRLIYICENAGKNTRQGTRGKAR